MATLPAATVSEIKNMLQLYCTGKFSPKISKWARNLSARVNSELGTGSITVSDDLAPFLEKVLIKALEGDNTSVKIKNQAASFYNNL